MTYKQPYTLMTRTMPSGRKIWYYRLADDPKRVSKSTGVDGTERNRRAAMDFVEKQIAYGTIPRFDAYAVDFFDWEKSPYLHRRREQKRGKQMGEGTAASRHGHVHNHLIPEFGHLRLDQITLGRFEDWLMAQPLSNQTKNHVMYTMGIIMKEAVRRGSLARNPLEGIEALDPDSRERDYLRGEELEKLFPRDMDDFVKVWPTVEWHGSRVNYGIMLALAATGGLRSGEIRALRWKHVSWEHSGIAVVAAKKYRNEEGTPKWNSLRPVILPARMMELLRWWFARAAATEPEDYVFPARDKRTLVLELREGMKKAKLDVAGRYLDVHALRHTYNTHMRGLVEDAQLRVFTGHKSLKMTEQYDHKNMLERLPRFAAVQDLIDRFPV